MLMILKYFPKLLISTVCAVSLGSASFSQDVNSTAERIDALLSEMGYINVVVDECRVDFTRKLPNVCPSNLSLSYTRSINLTNLDFTKIAGVYRLYGTDRELFQFHVPPTAKYYARSAPIIEFGRVIDQAYPETGWPFRFDSNTPAINEQFAQDFSLSGDYNWWISQSCFGAGRHFDIQFRMSFDEQYPLTQLKNALMDLNAAHQCSE